ncbi:MAG: DUF4153 domain-containing protein [Acidobacteriota bacterium]
MNDRTKTGLQILQVASILGIAGDVLLRQTPWGLNVFLFNLIFVAGTALLLLRRNAELLNFQSIALLGAQVFFSAMFLLRDSIELRVADTVAILAIMSVLLVPRLKIAPRVAGVFHYVIGFFWSAFNAWFASFMLLGSDIKWKQMPQTGWSKHLVAVMRGLAIVAPIILIFGGLFVAADAVYQGMVERIFNIQPETILTHSLLFAAFAWMSAGYLRGVTLGNEPTDAETPAAASVPDPAKASAVANEQAETQAAATVPHADETKANFESSPHLPDYRTAVEHINISDPPDASTAETPSVSSVPDSAESRPVGSVPVNKKPAPFDWAHIDSSKFPPALTLGSIEIGLIFGLIDLLFLSFVIVQIPYLFGGMDLVQNTPDFKLAEYARRGFGELVTVSALVLPILLAAHWLIRKDSPVAAKLFRVLAGIQIVLLFVIMASATQRLFLLTGNLGYGMTTIRLYPMILMSWLAIVFVWFALTVLRNARQYFAWGALWSAFFVLGATHFLNPDKLIVDTNIALMHQGREFDTYYNSHLSDDAIPSLVNAFDELDPKYQDRVVRRLAERYCQKTQEGDLRSWNLGRSRASTSLQAIEPAAETLGGCRNGYLSFPPAMPISQGEPIER